MAKQFLLIIGLLFSIQLTAQTGIGTPTPNASAKLDVSSSTMGFLPPRVTLTAANTFSPIVGTPSAAIGLLVYNLGSEGLAAGYYYWNGNAWATIATSGGSGSVAAEYGAQFLSSNVGITSGTPVDVISFTLPSAGIWEVITFLRAQGAAGYASEFAIYDVSNNLVPNSEILPAYGEIASTGTGVVRITTNGSAVYKVRAWASTGAFNVTSDFNGRTGVTWKKISGNSPMTVINFGDIKTGIQAGDHNGWIRLNGRAKSTLSATQQAQATALGIGDNLPNASNAFLVQNGQVLGSVTGSNTIRIAQNQLPNVAFTGSIISVAHGASVQASASGVFARVDGGSFGNATSAGGGSTNTFNLNIPLNGGVTQENINIAPQSLSVNTFIYLGN